MSEKDVKPKVYYIVDSSQLNNQPTRVYNTEPKWLIGAVEWTKVIELEPTLQLMKEMGDFLKKSELILSYQNLTTFPIHVREPDGSISMQRPKSQIGLFYDETKEVLEKYRKFLEGVEK